MKIYQVIVTRDTTESAFIAMEAEDEKQAKALAMERAKTIPFSAWSRDECATTDPYVTGCDEKDI